MPAGFGIAGNVDSARLRVDAQDYGGRQSAFRGLDVVPLGAQFFEDRLTDLRVDGEVAQLRRSLAEGAEMVARDEPGGRHRSGGIEPEVDQVEDQVEGDLILEVAAGHADGDDRFLVAQDDRGRQGDPRALARLDAVGMADPG